MLQLNFSGLYLTNYLIIYLVFVNCVAFCSAAFNFGTENFVFMTGQGKCLEFLMLILLFLLVFFPAFFFLFLFLSILF